MISRRAALQLGVVAGGLGVAGLAGERAGVLDDGLRAAGLRPHRTPDPRDVSLLSEAAAGQAQLIALFDTAAEGRSQPEVAAIRGVLREQLAAVSDAAPTPDTAPVGDLDVFVGRAEEAASARANGALAAGSLDVAKVLAAMSAGLEQ